MGGKTRTSVKPGQILNPKGRGVGSTKASAQRAVDAVVRAIGSGEAPARIYELTQEKVNEGNIDGILAIIKTFALPVLLEMIRKNQLEITASDELAEALRAAIAAKAKETHDRTDA